MLVVAGPCALEDDDNINIEIARACKSACDDLECDYYFKGSYDKANRSSSTSPRGPGLTKGSNTFRCLKRRVGCKTLTDVHSVNEVKALEEIALDCLDVLQIPSLLCRQTDICKAAAASPFVTNWKKGQFASVDIIPGALVKCGWTPFNPDPPNVWLTERGTTFGYNDIVIDMRKIHEMRKYGVPVLVDASHSAGDRANILPLAQAGVAAGASGIYVEVHPDPASAVCDGKTSLQLSTFHDFLWEVVKVFKAVNS